MDIAKEKLVKLLNPGNLTRPLQLTSEQNRYVREQFMNAGMTSYRFYNRCLCAGAGSGFDEWEVMGVNACIDRFCKEQGLPFVEDKSTFYDIACEGRREAFWNFMQPLGMSKVTVINRFKRWNFYEWELRGVEAIVEQIVGQDC